MGGLLGVRVRGIGNSDIFRQGRKTFLGQGSVLRSEGC